MSEKIQYSAEDTFVMWKHEMKEIGKARYTARERVEGLQLLAEMFFKHGVELEESKFFKKRVTEFLVTKEGMKGNGKYKFWKERTEEDFLASLLVQYQDKAEIVNETTNKKVVRKIEHYDGADYMDRTPLMVAWTKYKFKDNWTEALCLDAHKVGSSLWLLFDKEVISSKWAKSGERPDWAKNVF